MLKLCLQCLHVIWNLLHVWSKVSFCINNVVVVSIKTFFTYLKGERMFFIHFVIRGQDSGDVALENMIAPVYNCSNSEAFNI